MRLLALVTLALVALALTAHAQTPIQSHSDWARVQALPPGANLLLNASTRHGSCTVQSVTPDALTCTNGKVPTVARTDIKTIKISRRGRSALIGLGVGAAGGAIGGAASINDSGNFAFVSKADGALVFGVVFGLIGTLIGFFTDFARTTLYHA